MAPSPTSRKAREIFEEAIDCDPPDARAAFIAGACGGDAALLARVEALIRANAAAESLLPNEPLPPFSDVCREQLGDRIGRYRLLEKIGEGGMGVVYMAEQEEPVRRMVALKVIRPGMDSQSVIARFEAERQALALMDHPNIARVLDAGTTGRGEVGSQRSEIGGRKSEVGGLGAKVGGQKSEGGEQKAASGFQTAPAETNLTSDLRPLTSDPGRPFFVMELVRGVRITDYCTEQNLSTRDRLDLFTAVCSAVQHAHQKGIIHRDLKPSNILVTEIDGRPVPKVIDFGIARATEQKLTDKTLFTQFAQFLGTPAYMSPEQAALSGADIDTRSDIYSLGVLLYELLSGSTPFDARELLNAGFDEMRRIIRETEPPRPSTRLSLATTGSAARRLRSKSETQGKRSETAFQQQPEGDRRKPRANPESEIESDLDWIVMKCLEKDRARRYETAIGLAQDIQRHLASEPITARPPSAAYRLRKLVRRNKLAVAAGGAVLAALVIGLGVSTWMYSRAAGAEKAQREERRKAESEAEKSTQVAQFLKDMLQGVGPSVALGEDTTLLRKILDQTAERIGPDLKGQPEVEVDLRNTIGTVYDGLGDYDKAVAMFEEALVLARRIHGQEHAEVSEMLNNLALVLREQGKLEEAETMLQEALAMKRRLGVDQQDIATSIDNLARVVADRGRYDEGEKLHREALALKRAPGGEDNEDVAISLNNLALVLQEQQKFGDAEAALREALAIERKLNPDGSPLVATNLTNLAGMVQQQNRLEESESLFREALALQRKFLGDAHPNVAAALNGLGLALLKQDRARDAEPLLREAVAIEKKARTGPFPQTADITGNLGRVMEGLRLFPEAESLYREAIDIYSQLPGPEHPMMASWRNRLLNLLLSQKEWPELEALMREILASARRAASGREANAGVALALVNLAYPLRQQQKFPEAETLLLEGHATLQQVPDAPKELHRNALTSLVRLYEAWNQPDKAAEWREKLDAFEREIAKPDGEPKAN